MSSHSLPITHHAPPPPRFHINDIRNVVRVHLKDEKCLVREKKNMKTFFFRMPREEVSGTCADQKFSGMGEDCMKFYPRCTWRCSHIPKKQTETNIFTIFIFMNLIKYKSSIVVVVAMHTVRNKQSTPSDAICRLIHFVHTASAKLIWYGERARVAHTEKQKEKPKRKIWI